MTDEQEPEIHATAADLSPVSPSPVHAAAPLVVPALQNTVDTIKAMVAAVADAPDSAVESVANPTNEAAQDDFVDDDSFDDAYGEDTEGIDRQLPVPAEANDQDPSDDYAKMFDSPVGSDQEEEDQGASVDVSAAPTSTDSHAQPSPAQNDATSFSALEPAVRDYSTQNPHDTSVAQPAAQTPAGHDANVPALEATSAADALPANAQNGAQPPSQDESSSIINAHLAESHVSANPAALDADSVSNTTPGNASPATLASTSSLPPRPPIPQAAVHSYSQPSVPGSLPPPQTNAGAPGAADSAHSFQDNSAPHAKHPASAPTGPRDDYQHLWDQFMADERQYMSEAKWDRFPEGSRLFIGNLSSDKVSKRDVFEIFHRYGRLAQISLKSAYGFVQFHTIDEGNRAIQNLEGIEIKGRRIHLEVSKLQDKSKKERNKSPEKGGRGRDRDGSRKGDKYHDRDDRRGGRNHSPRRQGHHGRDDSYGGRDKFHDSGRGRDRDRSRSPGYGRHDKGGYRRRSNSPYGGGNGGGGGGGRSRQKHQDKELDLPRRYGAEVPDIQIILQQEVNRDFVGWVEHAFKEKGLRPEVMFLHPRFPKDQVIQRQAAEGVHAVVELDMRAQTLGKVPVQVFDRSAGSHNVRFDQYVDLDPATAGEVVLRAKAAGAAAAAYPPQQSYGGYQRQQYHPPQQQQHPPRGGAYTTAPPPGPYGQPVAAPAPAIPNMAEIAKLVGQVDNNTLQQILSAMAAPAPNAMPAPPAGNAQVDIHALLGALGGNPAGPPPSAPSGPSYGGAYGGQHPPPHSQGPPAPGGLNGDSAAVQNIMAQLARYRQ